MKISRIVCGRNNPCGCDKKNASIVALLSSYKADCWMKEYTTLRYVPYREWRAEDCCTHATRKERGGRYNHTRRWAGQSFNQNAHLAPTAARFRWPPCQLLNRLPKQRRCSFFSFLIQTKFIFLYFFSFKLYELENSYLYPVRLVGILQACMI